MLYQFKSGDLGGQGISSISGLLANHLWTPMLQRTVWFSYWKTKFPSGFRTLTDRSITSLKITLPQSKSLQPVAKARRLTACPSVKPSLDLALQQWIFASLKQFITVRKRPGKLAAALIWFTERNEFSSSTQRTASLSSLVEQRGRPVE